MNMSEMKVIKRNGHQEDVSFDKILNRVKTIGKEFNVNINYSALVVKVIDQLYSGIPTKKIDELTAEQCASLSTQHPDYAILASVIVVSNHQKSTIESFSETMTLLYNFKDINGKQSPLITKELYDIATEHSDELQSMLDFKRDYLIDFFGFKTLERAYMMKVNKSIVERPQHLWMRVAIGIHGSALDKVKETYDLMSQKYFTHATPTLFNAGTPHPQLSSCYLIAMENDSIDGIYNTLKDCAKISKWAGGIGLHVHNIRGTGSHIRGTNGTSNGIVPMLRVFNMTARYVDQCVVPETIIYTTNGPIEIQNCSIGETKIYNLKGEIETIENVLEHPYEGEILNIETAHSIDNLKITPDHPVCVLTNQPKGLNYNLIKNKLENSIEKFEWIDAKELTCDDMIVYKIPSHYIDIKNISEDDCYMYGIILGHGSMSNDSNYGYIQLHSTYQSHVLDFCKIYFENKFINYRIESIGENDKRIYWSKSIVLPFRYSDVYDLNHTKHIHYKWLNLPVEKCKYILKGLLYTDGLLNDEIVFDNSSRNLIESARFICMKMGFLPIGHFMETLNGENNTNKSYYLRVPKTNEICDLMNIERIDTQKFEFLRYNDYLLSRIINIKREKYSGVLYDLQMKNEHNYMIHNGIIHNGGGKRSGSFAIYLEPWHTDIEEFLELRKNHGDEEMRCRDLFLGLWTPDLFMERVKTDKQWSLFCPDQCPGLSDAYGDEFNKLYEQYETEGKAIKTLKARDLWFKILDAQMETGTPYILFKDAANKKSNQKNIGTIKSSNLCTEIIQYSSPEETAVCNLASISLTKFVVPAKAFNKAKIYSKTGCDFCVKSKILLKESNIFYEEIVLDDETERKLFYKTVSENENTTVNTVPQIYLDDEYVGGYQSLEQLLKPVFDYNKLHEVTKVVTENLNKIIDINFYPTEKTHRSNMLHRPIGVGVQGLADAFFMLDIPFHSQDAIDVNKNIFETMYHAALEKSMELSSVRREHLMKLYEHLMDNDYNGQDFPELFIEKSVNKFDSFKQDEINDIYNKIKPVRNELYNLVDGEFVLRDKQLIGAYSSFEGSPTSQSILQFDMWNVTPSSRYDWNKLKLDVVNNGIRNSLLLAPMPTASTSQILGNNECFEPVTSNIYTRRTLAGEFVIANKYLMNDLIKIGKWDESIKNNIIANKGSVQQLSFLSQHLKDKYKIVWEIPMKQLIDMSKDRGAFICQSQSLNLWMEDPDYKSLTSMHFYSHQAGLKTGLYYLRRKPKHQAQQFTIEPEKNETAISDNQEYENCEMCSG